MGVVTEILEAQVRIIAIIKIKILDTKIGAKTRILKRIFQKSRQEIMIHSKMLAQTLTTPEKTRFSGCEKTLFTAWTKKAKSATVPTSERGQ